MAERPPPGFGADPAHPGDTHSHHHLPPAGTDHSPANPPNHSHAGMPKTADEFSSDDDFDESQYSSYTPSILQPYMRAQPANPRFPQIPSDQQTNPAYYPAQHQPQQGSGPFYLNMQYYTQHLNCTPHAQTHPYFHPQQQQQQQQQQSFAPSLYPNGDSFQNSVPPYYIPPLAPPWSMQPEQIKKKRAKKASSIAEHTAMLFGADGQPILTKPVKTPKAPRAPKDPKVPKVPKVPKEPKELKPPRLPKEPKPPKASRTPKLTKVNPLMVPTQTQDHTATSGLVVDEEEALVKPHEVAPRVIEYLDDDEDVFGTADDEEPEDNDDEKDADFSASFTKQKRQSRKGGPREKLGAYHLLHQTAPDAHVPMKTTRSMASNSLIHDNDDIDGLSLLSAGSGFGARQLIASLPQSLVAVALPSPINQDELISIDTAPASLALDKAAHHLRGIDTRSRKLLPYCFETAIKTESANRHREQQQKKLLMGQDSLKPEASENSDLDQKNLPPHVRLTKLRSDFLSFPSKHIRREHLNSPIVLEILSYAMYIQNCIACHKGSLERSEFMLSNKALLEASQQLLHGTAVSNPSPQWLQDLKNNLKTFVKDLHEYLAVLDTDFMSSLKGKTRRILENAIGIKRAKGYLINEIISDESESESEETLNLYDPLDLSSRSKSLSALSLLAELDDYRAGIKNQANQRDLVKPSKFTHFAQFIEFNNQLITDRSPFIDAQFAYLTNCLNPHAEVPIGEDKILSSDYTYDFRLATKRSSEPIDLSCSLSTTSQGYKHVFCSGGKLAKEIEYASTSTPLGPIKAAMNESLHSSFITPSSILSTRYTKRKKPPSSVSNSSGAGGLASAMNAMENTGEFGLGMDESGQPLMDGQDPTYDDQEASGAGSGRTIAASTSTANANSTTSGSGIMAGKKKIIDPYKNQRLKILRCKRLSKDVLIFWRKHETEEKLSRKKAEKEAFDQLKMDEELREARRQQRKLNFLITQTELYAHFINESMGGGSGGTNQEKTEKDSVQPSLAMSGQEILKKLDDNFDNELSDTEIELEKQQAIDNARAALEANFQRTLRYEIAEQQPITDVAMSDHEDDLSGNLDKNVAADNFQSIKNQSASAANAPQPQMPKMKFEEIAQPKKLIGTLKPYQIKGLNWLYNLYSQGISGILADEMGLGKTVQTISLLASLAERKGVWGPFLIVTPKSTVHNWAQEIEKFCPSLKVVSYWGPPKARQAARKIWTKSQQQFGPNSGFHVLVTSYQMILTDEKYFQKILWQYMVLDEAQAIKSSSSSRWKTLLNLNCRSRLLLTGTPVQNSMAELWSLLHFIMPTLFDSHQEFNEWFSKDIEGAAADKSKSGLTQKQLSRLHMILKPFMLRRLKSEVQNELGRKIEIEIHCELSFMQKKLYQAIKNDVTLDDLLDLSSTSKLKSELANKKLMNLVMQFRKVCNHPTLFERRTVISPMFFNKITNEPTKDEEGVFSLTRVGAFREDLKFDITTNTNQNSLYYRLPRLVLDSGLYYTSADLHAHLPSKLKTMFDLYDPHRIQRQLQEEKSQYGFCILPRHLDRMDISLDHGPATHLAACSHTNPITRALMHASHNENNTKRKLFYEIYHPAAAIATSSDSIADSTVVYLPKHLALLTETSKLISPVYSKNVPQLSNMDRLCLITEDVKKTNARAIRRISQYVPKIVSAPINLDCNSRRLAYATSDYKAPFSRYEKAALFGVDLFTKSDAFYLERTRCPDVSLKMDHHHCFGDLATKSKHNLENRTCVSVKTKPLLATYALAHDPVSEETQLSVDFYSKYLSYSAPFNKAARVHPHGLFGQISDTIASDFTNMLVPDKYTIVSDSGKMLELEKLLLKLKVEGHRVLIYSQMTKMIDILEDYMKIKQYSYYRLDGQTTFEDRRDMVTDFQQNDAIFCFLLSTRAGGLGINLTAADTVIFYDSDWNPTVDQQAMDRAHRVGQTKQVTVYRLIMKNTVEDRILNRARVKSEIQKMVISGDQTAVTETISGALGAELLQDIDPALLKQKRKPEFSGAEPSSKKAKHHATAATSTSTHQQQQQLEDEEEDEDVDVQDDFESGPSGIGIKAPSSACGPDNEDEIEAAMPAPVLGPREVVSLLFDKKDLEDRFIASKTFHNRRGVSSHGAQEFIQKRKNFLAGSK